MATFRLMTTCSYFCNPGNIIWITEQIVTQKGVPEPKKSKNLTIGETISILLELASFFRLTSLS